MERTRRNESVEIWMRSNNEKWKYDIWGSWIGGSNLSGGAETEKERKRILRYVFCCSGKWMAI